MATFFGQISSGDKVQILIALFTGLGVVASMVFSGLALREVHRDRAFRQAPFLAFDPGGVQMQIEFKKVGAFVPGVNPTYAKKVFSELPPDAESVRLKGRDYGRLRNLGQGPALETDVIWVPSSIWFGSERMEVTKEKLNDPKFSAGLNRMPAVPKNIAPGSVSELTRLPTFIEKDVDKQVTKVEGVLRIACKDTQGKEWAAVQEFLIHTRYKEEPPTVTITFSDLQGLESATSLDLVAGVVKLLAGRLA